MFFVLAGVAPMGVVVALTVLAIALGNGAGVPGTYLVAGIVLALFAIGYVRMSRRVTNAGAFYAYATKGSATASAARPRTSRSSPTTPRRSGSSAPLRSSPTR